MLFGDFSFFSLFSAPPPAFRGFSSALSAVVALLHGRSKAELRGVVKLLQILTRDAYFDTVCQHRIAAVSVVVGFKAFDKRQAQKMGMMHAAVQLRRQFLLPRLQRNIRNHLPDAVSFIEALHKAASAVQGDKKYIIVVLLSVYHEVVQIVWERSNENVRTGYKDTIITVCRASNREHFCIIFSLHPVTVISNFTELERQMFPNFS